MKRILLLTLLVVMSAAIPAAADTTVSVTLTGVGGATQGGVHVAPYYLSINGGPTISAICDDYAHQTFIGQTWTATIHSFANLTGTRFGAGAAQQYIEAAWLVSQYLANPSQAGNINFAIWALFTPSVMSSSGWTAGAQAWYNSAIAWYTQNVGSGFAGFNLSNYAIVTPTSSLASSPQEFIIYVAEPGTLLLLGAGLFLLMFLWRKSASVREVLEVPEL